jgi:Flp pilus assembly pilin Flp
MIAKIGVFLRDEGGATAFELGVITAMVSVVAIHGLYLLMGGV